MGRRKKQVDLEESIGESKAAESRKNSELTEGERQALHYRHCREYEVALAAKKKSDAEIKNVGKRIKAEHDSVAKVKKTIEARSPEGEAKLKAEIAETAEVLRWSGVSVGETAELFPEDRTPGVDRARAEGRRAGLDGQAAKPPHDPSVPQYGAWMDGWQDGQGELASAFQKTKVDVPADLDTVDTSKQPFSVPPDQQPAAAAH